VLGLLEDVEEKEEIHQLLMWWDRCVYRFYVYVVVSDPPFYGLQANFPEPLVSATTGPQK
jgi:hypothetical protein